MKYTDVEVKQNPDGWTEALLPQNVATELGIYEHLQRGPIEFGSGKSRVKLRSAIDNAGFKDTSAR